MEPAITPDEVAPETAPAEPEPSETGAPSVEEEHAEEQAREPEPEETAQPQSLGPREIEERWRKADKAFEVYSKRIGAIFEEDAQDLLPFGMSPSAPPGFLNRHDAGRVPDEIVTAAMEFFGLAREQDYQPDPVAHTCGTCDGLGKTATGSKVPGNESRGCPSCGGLGYEAPGAGNGSAPEALDALHAPAGERAASVASGDTDTWGEPKVLPNGAPNPNFGKMPQFKVPVQPWGITANLTAQDAVSG